MPAISSSTATSGLASTWRKRSTAVISIARTSASRTESGRTSPDTLTLRPSTAVSSSARFAATRSITFRRTASSAGIATDSRTALTAHSTFRSRSRAIDSM
jgi:hypothetical protein